MAKEKKEETKKETKGEYQARRAKEREARANS